MKRKLLFPVIPLVLLTFSCEEPLDSVIDSVNKTNRLLQEEVWQLEDFKIEVKDDDIPPPILFSITNSIVKAGKYDLDDMVFDASEMRDYSVIFTPSRDIIASKGQIDMLGDSLARYFVFNDQTIRISSAVDNFNYSYIYDENNKTMSLTLTADQASSYIQDINDKIIAAISNRTPSKLGDLVAGLLYNNESIQKLINNLVVSALAGELEFINDFDPEAAAELLADKIIEALKDVDWEGELTDLLKTELEKITNIDPDLVAGEIAKEVSEAVNELLSAENIYRLVQPFLNELATDPDGMAESITYINRERVF